MCKEDAKRIVGYVRVSSESQKDNTSIDTQIEKITMYCKLHDYVLVSIFKDEGLGGSSFDKRTGYNDMMEYISIQDNNVFGIVIFKTDRLHRSACNLLNMVRDLDDLKVSLISITESFVDTSTSQGRLFITMMAGFSEFEKDLINTRTKGGRIATAQAKKVAGGSIPYGYSLKDTNTLELDIIESEASIVKRMFKEKSEGKSLQKVADILNNEGLLNNDKQWLRQTVFYMLNNTTYIGEYKYDGKKEANNVIYEVPKIISKQLWNKVHASK